MLSNLHHPPVHQEAEGRGRRQVRYCEASCLLLLPTASSSLVAMGGFEPPTSRL